MHHGCSRLAIFWDLSQLLLGVECEAWASFEDLPLGPFCRSGIEVRFTCFHWNNDEDSSTGTNEHVSQKFHKDTDCILFLARDYHETSFEGTGNNSMMAFDI